MDRILHLIKKSMLLTTVKGAECLTIRSIRTDRKGVLRSIESSLRIVYCISFGTLRKNPSFLLQ